MALSTPRGKKAATLSKSSAATKPNTTKHNLTWIKNDKHGQLKGKYDNITGTLQVIVRAARTGVDTDVFYGFAGIVDMPDKFLAEMINITTRTLSNYKELQKTLEPTKAEHLLKLITLFKKGEEILGNLTELKNWLNKPMWKSKDKYIDWLNTPGGVDLVSQELDRLAEGYSL